MTVHEYGTDKEKTIVLIHPSVVMWDYFEYVIPLFAEKYHLVVPALPGYDEEHPEQDFTGVEEIAGELAKWLTARGLRLQYWYGDQETKDRAWDIRYVKSNFPRTEFIKLKNVGHAGMASLHPEKMAARIEALANGRQRTLK